MGYELIFEGTEELVPRTKGAYYDYGDALKEARTRAARHRRNVVIRLRFFNPYAVVWPDGTVRPAAS